MDILKTKRNTRWRSGMAIAAVVAGIGILASPAHAIDLLVEATDTAAGPGNCYPFGGPGNSMYYGFAYQNIPAFTASPGDTIAFDLGDTVGANIELNIAMAHATTNGGNVQDGIGFVNVVTAGTPADPDGDTTVGNYELVFTFDAPYTFPGGGLLIRFQPTGAYASYSGCDQVLMSGGAGDSTGYFASRFYSDADGVSPWDSIGTTDIGNFHLVTCSGPAPDLAAASDSGASNSDDITNDNTPTFIGTVTPGATVRLYDTAGPTLRGTVVADGTTGDFSVTSTTLADGVHNMVFTEDTGVEGPPGCELAVTIDTVRPFISSIDRFNPATTPTNAASVTWRATFNEDVDGATVGTADFTLTDFAASLTGEGITGVAPNSASEYDVTADSGTGTGTLRCNFSAADGVTDIAGNAANTNFTTGQTYGIDTVAPNAPSTPDLAASSDSGSSNSDDITNDDTPTFNGTAEANSTVELFSDVDGSLGTTPANGSGLWSLTSGVSLVDGAHLITATATDAADNVSTPSMSLALLIDTTITTPTLTLDPASDTGTFNNDSYSNDTTPRFTGTAEDGSTVVLNSDVSGALASGPATGGNWDLTSGVTLSEGTHNVTATSTDLAGNFITSVQWPYYLDITPPSATIDLQAASDTGLSDTDNITNDDTPTFDGTTSEPDCSVFVASSLDGALGSAPSAAGTWTLTTGTLINGPHAMSATATDLAGNVGTPAVLSIVLDLVPPFEACGGELSVVGPSLTSVSTVSFAALFNENVYNVMTSTFGAAGPGTVVAASPLVTPDSTVTVDVDMTGVGTVTVSYANPGDILDVAGNAFTDAGGSTAQVTFIDISATQVGNRLADANGVLNDRFGASVAVSGETILVGAPSDDDAGSNAGSVFVLNRDGASSFTEAQILTASNAAANDRFGESVAISGDWAVVGAPYNDTAGIDAGTVYVFHLDGGTTWTEHSQITGSGTFTYHRFGFSVGISGNTIVVGSPLGYVSPGGVYRSGLTTVFEYDGCGDTWNETQVLQASDATSNDNYGNAVAISGTRLIVGAPLDDDSGNSTGSAYIYTRLGGNWIETSKINHTLPGRFDYFGQSVSMSEDGFLALIGAPGRDNIGALNSGAAYVFERTGLSWNQTDELVASDATNYDAFGQSVGISTDGAVVGSYKDDTEQLDAGSAYLFTGGAGAMSELSKVLPLSGDQGRNDNMGTAAAMSGVTAVVGSPFGNDQTLGVPGSVNTGSAYVFRVDQ